MIDWANIDTVFLDMDGTLLDLNFDTHFWRVHVPQRYAELHGLSVDEARSQLYPRFSEVEGTMDWYCLDFWSRELNLDIPLLKEEVDHLISVFPYVTRFLDSVRAIGRRTVLVTNAHHKSLELKMNRTELGGHLDHIVCAHDLKLPKENCEFWARLHAIEPFDAKRTLLVDDNLEVLRAARTFGITHLLAVHQPDSASPPRDVGEFAAIHSFRDIMPDAAVPG